MATNPPSILARLRQSHTHSFIDITNCARQFITIDQHTTQVLSLRPVQLHAPKLPKVNKKVNYTARVLTCGNYGNTV